MARAQKIAGFSISHHIRNRTATVEQGWICRECKLLIAAEHFQPRCPNECRPCRWKYENKRLTDPIVSIRRKKQALASTRKTIRRRRIMLDAIKNVPCLDCKQLYPPYVMDFDHRPGENKLFGIGAHIASYSDAKLLAEIAKCDIVCSNCHRIRTEVRRHGRA